MEIMKEILLFIVSTLALGIVGMWLYDKIKNRKPQREISFDIISCQSYDNKKEGVVHLEVVCNGEKVDKSVVVLTGKFINTGKENIKYVNIFEDDYITLSFGDYFECLDFSLISSNTEFDPTVLVDNKVAKCTWSLMKTKESFDVQIIAQYTGDDAFILYLRNLFCNSLLFHGRGDGIDYIKISRLDNLDENMIFEATENILKEIFMIFAGGVFLFVALENRNILFLIAGISFICTGVGLIIKEGGKISRIKKRKRHIQQNALLDITDTREN